MLNPRSYFEDCLRYGKMGLWMTGMPWEAVNNCIDNNTFEYLPSAAARHSFEGSTKHAWDCLDDSPIARVQCPNPKCQRMCEIPWTSLDKQHQWASATDPGSGGAGFADPGFNEPCVTCGTVIDHKLLRAQKFRRDMQLLMTNDVPMPGTILSIGGRFNQIKILIEDTDTVKVCLISSIPQWG